MGKKIVDPLSIKEELLRDLEKFHRENLLSVILYGSALTPDYKPGISDINILVILKDRALNVIGSATGYHRKWEKRNVHISFYFTESFVRDSLDVFPIEFLNMQHHYHVMRGLDVLGELAIRPADLRLQCERELRGKSVHLRREFLLNSGSAKLLQSSMKMTFRDFLPIFKALVFLKGESIPEDRGGMIKKLVAVYDIREDILEKIHRNAFGKSVSECIRMYYDYSSVIDSLIRRVDQLVLEKE